MALEAPVVNRTMLDASRLGGRLFRNNRGQFYTMDGVKALIVAVKVGFTVADVMGAVRRLRIVRAGLEASGASDLVGITPIVITPEMVGMTLGIMTIAECKAPGWKSPSGDHERQQANFIEQMTKLGAIGFFITNHEDLQEKINAEIRNKISQNLLTR